ncbi:MFS transporter [Candidatus Pacearchaeota archaeon]|nr:MFS transporter [Candidatus Pacearchaeota archaeon]
MIEDKEATSKAISNEKERPKITISRFSDYYRKKYMPEFEKLKGPDKKIKLEFQKQVDVEERKAIDKSLGISIKEGCAASVTGGVGDSYMSAFAVQIGATNSEIAALTSIPNLISPLAQLITPKLIEKRKRKGVAATAVLLQALMWLPMIVVALVFMKGDLIYAPILIIMFWTVYAALGNSVGPAWNSWMGDLVPSDKRGKYFGRRNTICGLVSLTSTIIAGILLQYSKTAGIVFMAFAILFSLALIFRSVSSYLLRKQYEPELHVEEGYYFSFIDFVKKMKYNNFGRFTIYISLLVLTVNIAGPFFTPYVLRELKFSYIQFMIAMLVIPGIVTMLSMPLWGKFSDKYGTIKTMQTTWIIVCILPALWLISDNFWYIMIVPQIASGLGWAGFNLAAGNFIFDATSRQRRSLCFAYHAVLNGIGVFIGATLGGFVLKYADLNIKFMDAFLFIFLISAVFRILVSLIFLPKIKEVRQVEKAKPLLSYLHIYPFSQLDTKHSGTSLIK